MCPGRRHGEKMELVCIVCPNGCRLSVKENENGVEVVGAKCKRGENFARTELTCPMRTVTTSVKTTVENFPVVSVKTDGEIPKEKVFPLINLLKDVVITNPLPIGTIVLSNVFDTGVNIVTTTNML